MRKGRGTQCMYPLGIKSMDVYIHTIGRSPSMQVPDNLPTNGLKATSITFIGM